MNRLLFILFLLPISLLGQVRPDQAPLVNSPDTSNFEVYGQKGGSLRRTTLDRLGEYVLENLTISYDETLNRVYLNSFGTNVDSINLADAAVTASLADTVLTINGTDINLSSFDNSFTWSPSTYTLILNRAGVNDTISLAGLSTALSYDNNELSLILGSDSTDVSQLRQTLSYNGGTGVLTLSNGGGSVTLDVDGLTTIFAASYFGGAGTSGDPLTIDDGGLTFTKLQDINNGSILGRYSTGAGVIEQLTFGTGFAIDSGTGVITVSLDSTSGISPAYIVDVNRDTGFVEVAAVNGLRDSLYTAISDSISLIANTWLKPQIEAGNNVDISGDSVVTFSIDELASFTARVFDGSTASRLLLTPDVASMLNGSSSSIRADSSLARVKHDNYEFSASGSGLSLVTDSVFNSSALPGYFLQLKDDSTTVEFVDVSTYINTSTVIDTSFSSDGTDIASSFFTGFIGDYDEINLDAVLGVAATSGLIINLPTATLYEGKEIFISNVDYSSDYITIISGVSNANFSSQYRMRNGEVLHLKAMSLDGSVSWVAIASSEVYTRRYSAGAGMIVTSDNVGITASKVAGTVTVTIPQNVNMQSFRFVGSASDLSSGEISFDFVGGYRSGSDYNTSNASLYHPVLTVQQRGGTPYQQRPHDAGVFTIYDEVFSTSGTVSVRITGLSGDFGIMGQF